MWSRLPPDLLRLISQLLATAGDLARFRAVCSDWRSAASAPSPHHLLPLLVLPSLRRFLPLSQPPPALPPPLDAPSHCCGSSSSFLSLLDGGLRLILLNPFIPSLLPLPPPVFPDHLHLRPTPDGLSRIHLDGSSVSLVTFRYACRYLLSKLVLSSDPRDGDCLVAAIHSFSRGLAFCRPRDPSWMVVRSPADTVYADVTFHGGRFYAVDYRMQLYTCGDILVDPNVIAVPVALPGTTGRCDGTVNRVYLAELEGELLMVVRWGGVQHGEEGGGGEARFLVYMLVAEDGGKRRWTDVDGLGGYALFLGLNRAAALAARDFRGCRRNCIYYTGGGVDGYGGGVDYGIYDMEKGCAEATVVAGAGADDDQRSSTWQSAVWLTPNPFWAHRTSGNNM